MQHLILRTRLNQIIMVKIGLVCQLHGRHSRPITQSQESSYKVGHMFNLKQNILK